MRQFIIMERGLAPSLKDETTLNSDFYSLKWAKIVSSVEKNYVSFSLLVLKIFFDFFLTSICE